MSVSGAAEMQFRNDRYFVWSGWEAYRSSIPWTVSEGNGVKTVYARFRDAAGNVANTSAAISLDTVGPGIEYFRIAGGARYATSRNVTLSIAVSGATQMRFRNDGVPTWSSWQTAASSAAWRLTDGDGWKFLHAEFRDNASNVSGTGNDIYLDTSLPTVSSFTIDSVHADDPEEETRSTPVILRMSVSGAQEMRFANGGSSWSSWEQYGGSKSWSLTSGDGGKTVYAEFRDAAGNIRQVIDTILLDEFRRVRITLTRIEVIDDSDAEGSAELEWEFVTSVNDPLEQSIFCSTYYDGSPPWSADDGDITTPNCWTNVRVRRAPGSRYSLRGDVKDVVGDPPGDEGTASATLWPYVYYWQLSGLPGVSGSPYSKTLDDGEGLRVNVTWTIEAVD
jgi:hypothetical protein